MAQRHQRGWLKKEKRAQGETWVLFFRTTRQSNGKRVENKVPIGLVRHLPEASSAWAEVERLHVPINGGSPVLAMEECRITVGLARVSDSTRLRTLRGSRLSGCLGA